MNQYTAAVHVIEQYIQSTEPLFTIAARQRSFDGLQSQIQHALLILKENVDYTEDRTVSQ